MQIFYLGLYNINSVTLSTSVTSDKSIIKAFNKLLAFYQFQINLWHNIHQVSDLLSISKHCQAQYSTILWYYINFRAIYSLEFIKPLIFYQFHSIIRPSINQASDLLSISSHYPDHNSTSLLSYINFRAIYSQIFSDTLQLIFDPFYSKHEAIDNPYNRISEEKLLVDSFAIELKDFQ